MSKYYRRRNPKIITLIIELVLLGIDVIVWLILENTLKKFNYLPLLIIAAVLIFFFILTLSLMRYDALREIREDGSFKSTNLPLYTDNTALMGHDIRDENEKEQ